MRRIDGGLFQVRGDIDDLTHGFILHPFACALALLAGFASVGGVIGSLIGSILASIAWLLTLAVLIVDFVVFTVSFDGIRHCVRLPLTQECRSMSRTTSSRIDQGRLRISAWGCGLVRQLLSSCS